MDLLRVYVVARQLTPPAAEGADDYRSPLTDTAHPSVPLSTHSTRLSDHGEQLMSKLLRSPNDCENCQAAAVSSV